VRRGLGHRDVIDDRGCGRSGSGGGHGPAEYMYWRGAVGSVRQSPEALVGGTDRATAVVPDELVIGPNSLMATNDGTNSVFAGLMLDQDLWR